MICARGLASSPNHGSSYVITDQSPYRKFYHTYRYYLRAFYHTYRYYLRSPFGQVEILSGIYYIYIVYIRADYNDASSGFGLWAKTLRWQQSHHQSIYLIVSYSFRLNHKPSVMYFTKYYPDRTSPSQSNSTRQNHICFL